MAGQGRRRIAPELGEHTIEVLRSIGRTDEQIAQLIDTGVIGTPAPD